MHYVYIYIIEDSGACEAAFWLRTQGPLWARPLAVRSGFGSLLKLRFQPVWTNQFTIIYLLYYIDMEWCGHWNPYVFHYKCWVFHIYVNQLEGNPIVPWASFFISGQISQSHSIFQACNWLIITNPRQKKWDGSFDCLSHQILSF